MVDLNALGRAIYGAVNRLPHPARLFLQNRPLSFLLVGWVVPSVWALAATTWAVVASLSRGGAEFAPPTTAEVAALHGAAAGDRFRQEAAVAEAEDAAAREAFAAGQCETRWRGLVETHAQLVERHAVAARVLEGAPKGLEARPLDEHAEGKTNDG